jgi:hypothetical protein
MLAVIDSDFLSSLIGVPVEFRYRSTQPTESSLFLIEKYWGGRAAMKHP